MTHFEYSKPTRMGATSLSGNSVLCAVTKTRDLCARTLPQRKLPVENRLGSGDFDPTSNKSKVITMTVSKGLEFPVVALPSVGHLPAAAEGEKKRRGCFMWLLRGPRKGS